MQTVAGFRFGGIAAGIKESGKPDLALLVADEDVAAAAVFTQNRVKAAPVLLSRERVRGGRSRGVLVNAGNANACTGDAGMDAAHEATRAFAEGLGCKPKRLLMASTGIIGVPLPVEKITGHRDALLAATSAEGFDAFASAILTTDKGPKTAHVEFSLGRKKVQMVGCTKGAGMIAPNMATTLAFVATDAAVDPAFLRTALRGGADATFNVISVDGDTSTNDSLFVFASGRAGNSLVAGPTSPSGSTFRSALRDLLEQLAVQIVRDGEGATRVVTIEVEGGRSERDAVKVARRIGASPLVKTAIFGADPNWGRILCAVGNAGVDFDTARVDITIGDVQLVKAGVGVAGMADAAHAVMKQSVYPIRVHLHGGKAKARHITCDLTREYVTINADYST